MRIQDLRDYINGCQRLYRVKKKRWLLFVPASFIFILTVTSSLVCITSIPALFFVPHVWSTQCKLQPQEWCWCTPISKGLQLPYTMISSVIASLSYFITAIKRHNWPVCVCTDPQKPIDNWSRFCSVPYHKKVQVVLLIQIKFILIHFDALDSVPLLFMDRYGVVTTPSWKNCTIHYYLGGYLHIRIYLTTPHKDQRKHSWQALSSQLHSPVVNQLSLPTHRSHYGIDNWYLLMVLLHIHIYCDQFVFRTVILTCFIWYIAAVTLKTLALVTEPITC